MSNGDAPNKYYSGWKPIHDQRHLKVVCIGAGASGLLLAYKLQRSFDNFELILYEKNDAISGTWYENKYPGFSKKYDLEKYIKLSHEVSQASWNSEKGGWDLEVTHLLDGSIVHDYCDILVNASGVLNDWRWPDISGLKSYKGKLLHTARWDANVDLNGKHVGLIGNGSSGIQVLPAIKSQAREITTFLRRPTWVSPAQGTEQHVYSEEERKTFETDPKALLQYRKRLETSTNEIFPLFITESEAQKATYDNMLALMKGKLQNESLEKMVIPNWAVGCRRITPGVNYLETLSSENVNVIFGDITKITEKGCISNGKEYPVDVLICATGFDTSYKPRFPLIGLSGERLSDVWSQESKSYFGMAAHDFPNYFMFMGPNSPIGNGPVLIAMEAQADYMLKMMDRWQTENIHSFSPKQEAVEDFIAHKDIFMKGTVWDQDCRSWYKRNSVSGKVTALWPGSTLHYLEAIADPRYEDWDFKYNGNRYSFFGNGFSQTEVDKTADLAYYIRNEDDGPYMSRVKRTKLMSKSGTVDRSATGASAAISV